MVNKDLHNVQCQQQNQASHHSSSLLQFNVCFLCLHIWQDVHAVVQQSPQTIINAGGITCVCGVSINPLSLAAILIIG